MTILKGKVISDKVAGMVVVEVERTIEHPLYHKRIKRTKKYHADNQLKVKAGDVVEIVATRPLSATKHWRISRIV